MNPPSALAGAMSRDRKPFTYTPGGLDLSEIKSSRMAARLMRNAMNEGVPEVPKQHIQSPPMPSTTIAVPNYNCLPVQVFPTFNLPANPKSLLRTRSNPSQPRDPPLQRVPPPQQQPSQFVNNSRAPGATQYDTFNKNTPTYSQVNNNRPVSMFEYGTPAPANTYTPMNYGSDVYTSALPEISYEAEYFRTPPKINTSVGNAVHPPGTMKNGNNVESFSEPYIPKQESTLPFNEPNKYQGYFEDNVQRENENKVTISPFIDASQGFTENIFKPDIGEKEITLPIIEINKYQNYDEIYKPTIENNEIYAPLTETIKSDNKFDSENKLGSENKLQYDTLKSYNVVENIFKPEVENQETVLDIVTKPIVGYSTFVPEAIVSKPIEDITGSETEKKEIKTVKKQAIRIENNVEDQNGSSDQNGDSEVQAVIKLPAKKSAAKTETKVEVTKSTLPDGSIEEVKKTITKTTIDGRTEIKTKTETTIIPKDDDEEEEEEIEEEEEESGEVSAQKVENKQEEVEEPKLIVVKKSTEETVIPKENSRENIIRTEERSETTTTTSKKVVVVQDEEEEQKEEEEEVVEVDEEIEEEEPVTFVIKQPVEKTEPPQQKDAAEEPQDEEEEEEEEIEEAKEQEVTAVKEEISKDEVQTLEPPKNEEVEEEEEEEEVEEEEQYEEAEEKETVEKSSELIADTKQKKDDEEQEKTEENVEVEEKEFIERPTEEIKAPTEEPKTTEVKDDKVEQTQEVTEEKQEVVVEKQEYKSEKQTDVPEETRTIKVQVEASEPKVPLREPSVPLEKVEDVEIKPIGLGDFLTKTRTENTEIITNISEKPTGLLTEMNRIENIVTVNRTTKTLDHAYENITQQGIPTVKTYFTPHIDKISTSPQPARPYHPVYPPEPTTERRHSLLLERLSVERQMPSYIDQNNYQYSNQTVEQQRQWSQEPQAEVLTVSNVKPSQITNQQWYQQKDNAIYNNVSPSPQPAQSAPSWTQPKPQTQPLYQPQPQFRPSPQPQYQAPTPQPQYQAPTPQPQYQAPTPQPQYQAPPQPQPQPQYQPTYTESVHENTSNTYQNTYSTYTPKPTNWASNTIPASPIPTIITPSQPSQYSYLNKDSSESYQKTTQHFSSSSYVPPPWEQDSNYVAPDLPQNFYQPAPQTSSFSPATNEDWKPNLPTSKFNKTPPTAYIPPKPNQSFVMPVSSSEPPKTPGRKTYYSEYERRYISVPESTYIPGESKYQPQPDPSPAYYYDNNEPTETVEPQWRRELREFTEKSQTQTTATNIQPPWEAETKYAKAPEPTYTPTPTWSQTVRPQSWRERSFESEFVSQEWPKTNTLGRGRPLSSYGKESIPERTRGVSVDRYNPNSYQSPVAAEHPPVQTHTHVPPAPHATGYHNPNVPAYHARASAEPREQVSYQQPRNLREARASPFQSRSFKYLQWITGTED